MFSAIDTITPPPNSAKRESLLRLVLLKKIPDDAKLQQQWNELVLRLDSPQVFLTYEWALAVQRAYSETLLPLIFLAYDSSDCLCGVAALGGDRAGREATFLCATTGDYCDFVSAAENKTRFVGDVLGELRKSGFEDITLANLPADSTTVPALRKACRDTGYLYFARTAYECAQVSLARLERRPGENRPVLPRKKMLRRFFNAMGREHPVRLEHAGTWDAIEPILNDFMQAHIARFLVTGRISNMARPERRVFLAELAKLLSPPGWVALTRMMSGEQTYAWNYGFRFQGTWFWYQPTFDSDLEKYSPGFCLLAKLIEEAADQASTQLVDLGLGAEEYKERFANQTRETLYVTLRTSAARYGKETVRYRVAEGIRRVPRLESVVRRSVALLARLQQDATANGVAAILRKAAKRMGSAIFSNEEVFFFDWVGPDRDISDGFTLRPLTLNLLAVAVARHVEDQSTLDYLLRSAARLGESGREGFALVDAQGIPVHFAWVAPFAGFYLAELNDRVEAPQPEAMMIFDCWSPQSERGRGYYGRAVSAVAQLIRERGQEPWIFSAAANLSSLRGLEKTGFRRRYSLVRRRILAMQTIGGSLPRPGEAAQAMSARI